MQGNSFHVLLIEDDQNLAKMYKIKFRKEGFDIVTAADGEQGLQIFHEQPVDIILLDMLLPKLSGKSFLEQIRQLPQGKNTPVIILSNHTSREDAQDAYNLGVKEYLSKAMFTPEQVVEKVKSYLPHH